MTPVYHLFAIEDYVSTIMDRAAQNVFRDYYETLQLSPKADADAIGRIYHLLIKRYHPDNSDTGDPEKFHQVLEAHRILSDPDQRAAYDAQYEQHRTGTRPISTDAPLGVGNFQKDRKTSEAILSLLYTARRRDPEHAGMGTVHMERSLNCPPEHLDFHLWYLLEKKWIQRMNNGTLAITASGVDRVIDGEAMLLRRDRLIPETASVVDDPDLRMLR